MEGLEAQERASTAVPRLFLYYSVKGMLPKYKIITMYNRLSKLLFLLALPFASIAQQRVDYSIVSVPEESGIDLLRITSDNDYVCMPEVSHNARSLKWFSNRILGISKDGSKLAYLSLRNNTTNIFIKDLYKQGSSIQRTNRQSVIDFTYSTDGKFICYTEQRGKLTQVFQTDASTGYVCRQITSGANDYSPVYSSDMSQIFFCRQERKSSSIWSHDVKNNFLSTYSSGMNPCPLKGTSAFLCARINDNGKSDIWRVDYKSGVEECIISDPNRGFSTPMVSPDGKWILLVGESVIDTGTLIYRNTDIYVCRIDGTELTQLTYHAADDISPVWSNDGHYIYFVSQRGSADALANIWRISFNL